MSSCLYILQKLFPESVHYLEFGMGKSTALAAASSSIKTIDAVESGDSWLKEFIKTNPALQQEIDSGRVTVHLIDISPTRQWGNPSDTSKKHLWPNYPLAVFNRSIDWDLVLIDGRFRVASCLASILGCSPSVKICFDDFWNRPFYHVVLQFLDEIDRYENAALFTPKKQLDRTVVQEWIARYLYVTD